MQSTEAIPPETPAVIIIPGSTRADGSVRRAVRIRASVPTEEFPMGASGALKGAEPHAAASTASSARQIFRPRKSQQVLLECFRLLMYRCNYR